MKPLFFITLLPLAVLAASDPTLESLLHDGNNKFTAKMFSEVAKTNPEKSFVLSAFSVLTPLAQLGLASVGESHDELLQAIGMPSDNVTKEVFSAVKTNLRSIKGVTLKTASKIYVAKNYELNQEFSSVTRDIFDSEVQNVNFLENQKTAQEINTWVEQQTNNRIKDLVTPDSLTSDTRALLVNAIYFKGSWLEPFKKHLTRESDFHVNNNKAVKVPMMYRKGEYRYTESAELKCQAIEIPYEGGEAAMVILLPRDIEGINELKEALKDPNALDNTLKQMYEQEVELHVPKFKIETTTDLKDVLSKINVQKLFKDGEARLDNLLKNADSLYIDQAKQKAFIEVNEEGSEAGAANVFQAHFRSALIIRRPRVIIKFIADHPFVFYIRERNNVLFSGAYNP